MNQSHPETLTQHAMRAVWGQFAQSIGLIDQIQSVSPSQKTVEHSPQRKILEFLVPIPSSALRADSSGGCLKRVSKCPLLRRMSLVRGDVIGYNTRVVYTCRCNLLISNHTEPEWSLATTSPG
jgi:hypothetical protein